ncbi:MAG: amidohydrolase family protein [Candidatus Korobacteraceae bacterium]
MRFRGLVLFLLCWSIATHVAVTSVGAQTGASETLAITAVTIVDVTANDASSALRSGQTVIVHRGKITHVGPTGKVTVPRGAQYVDGRGKYLVPGLWDAHVHLSNTGPSALPAYVANGITSVRDLGGSISDFRTWERQFKDGSLVGPRLFKAGPNIEGAWWLDRALAVMASDPALAKFPMLKFSPRERLDGPKDASRAVGAIAALSVDVVKFRNLRPSEFQAVAAEAKKRGLPLAGHMPRGVSIGEAAEQGLRSLEHAESVTLSLGDADDIARRAQFRRVASAGAAITPTLVSDVAYRQTPDDSARKIISDTANRIDPRRRYVARQLLDGWNFGLASKRFDPVIDWAESHRRQVADMHRAFQAGVPLLVGTDLGTSLIYPGFSVHEELQLLVREVRLSPFEALRAATINPARNLGLADTTRGIAVGQRADLVLLDADPLQDIQNATRIRGVVLNGRFLSRANLDTLLMTAEKLARE